MSQNIPVKSGLTNDMILKYGSIISAGVFGSIIIGYLIYLIANSGGSSSGGSSKKSNRKFLGYSSLDKLYDEAGGNDPLSNARLTSDINLSSDTQSCKFQIDGSICILHNTSIRYTFNIICIFTRVYIYSII